MRRWKKIELQSSVRGGPSRTLCLKYLAGKTHDQAPLLHWAACELRWSTTNILKRTGVFTITKLLPPQTAELQYRIKSEHEAHERVASENELRIAELEKPIVAAGRRVSSVVAGAARIFAGLS
jgi:hypothetical protein